MHLLHDARRDVLHEEMSGAGGIGSCIRQAFEQAGAKVCIIDIADNPYLWEISVMNKPCDGLQTR